jgi:hypothetical protein
MRTVTDMTNGRRLLIDPSAKSADESSPASISRPDGAPVYHGFPVVPETYRDGWCLGAITEFADPSRCTWGDAYMVAPDGTRAGLVWKGGDGEMDEILPPAPDRWGVYSVWFPHPIRTAEDLAQGFRTVLPQLKEVHACLMGMEAGNEWQQSGEP